MMACFPLWDHAWCRRAAALTLLVMVVTVVARLGIYPLVDAYLTLGTRLENNRETLARLQAMADQPDRLRAQLDQMVARQQSDGLFLDTAQGSPTAAALYQDLRRMVQENGARLSSIQTLAPDDDGGLTRVGVRAVLSTTLGQFYRILHSLEAGKPYRYFDNLEIQVRRNRNKNTDAGAEEQLTVRFDLHAFVLAAPI